MIDSASVCSRFLEDNTICIQLKSAACYSVSNKSFHFLKETCSASSKLKVAVGTYKYPGWNLISNYNWGFNWHNANKSRN